MLSSCKDEYMPKLKNVKSDILVVEGYIDGANGTNVSLSKVAPFGDTDTSFQKYVADATIIIEDDRGTKFPLSNNGNGNYSAGYSLSTNNNYRLVILTQNQKKYVSDFVVYKRSPAINSVSYKLEEGGARFYVSTRDNNNQSKYYRWKFEETWRFHSFYNSNLKYDRAKKQVVNNPEQNYYCWQSDYSKEILIHSTANLSQDVLQDMPINFIPTGSIKLSDIYSINVRQFVMDSLGYNYYRQLKKNTEETGSIFDPQPGNLRGNIKNINDSSEIVIGYIGAGSSYQVRKYFQIPWNYKEDCADRVLVLNVPDSIHYYYETLNYWPISHDTNIDAWVSSQRICADCTIRGSNFKPSYWPY
jgi:hypothetical protein